MSAINDRADSGNGAKAVNTLRQAIDDLAEAARSATFSVLDEQKERAAQEVANIAGAIRHCSRSLDETENQAVAKYVEGLAGQIENVAGMIRRRRWREIVEDTEDFARRRPAIFMLGSVAAGFVAGCFFAAQSDGGSSASSAASEAGDYGKSAPPPPAQSAFEQSSGPLPGSY